MPLPAFEVGIPRRIAESYKHVCRYHSVMATPQLEDLWRARVAEAQREHDRLGTTQTRAELRRVLAIFTNLVINGKTPPTS